MHIKYSEDDLIHEIYLGDVLSSANQTLAFDVAGYTGRPESEWVHTQMTKEAAQQLIDHLTRVFNIAPHDGVYYIDLYWRARPGVEPGKQERFAVSASSPEEAARKRAEMVRALTAGSNYHKFVVHRTRNSPERDGVVFIVEETNTRELKPQ